MKIGRTMIPAAGLHTDVSVRCSGAELKDAAYVMIMVHGRGASAESILELSQYFHHPDVAYLSPQATTGVWYPLGFLAPIEQNEPWLSAALVRLTEIVEFVKASGIPEERIMLLGFSQGASLSLEWTARNAPGIRALFALSGGIIGPPGTPREYQGTFNGTTVFIGCSDVDFHIPKERVEESAGVLQRMHADVTLRIYPNMGHTVNDDEVAFIARIIDSLPRFA